MAGEVISVIAQASTPSSWVDTPVLRSVSESDAGRLSDLLSAQSSQASAPVTGVDATSAASSPGNSLGDAILRSMDSIGKNYKSKIVEMEEKLSVENAPLSTSDLIRMQFQLIDTSLTVDIVSKAVSKATQHIDQLTKLQ